jgi:integrase
MGNRASAYTVKAERSALRMFFGNPKLAQSVRLKKRKRGAITRSRGIAIHDKHFQPANWQSHIAFALATGLRRSELRDLRIRDIFYDHDGTLIVHVVNGKGGREREVRVLPGKEEDVLAVIAGRDPNQRVFTSIPKHMDVHSYRRLFAQALYLYHAPGWELPPTTGRLKPSDYHRPAAEKVSIALGHSRVSVVLRHYIR